MEMLKEQIANNSGQQPVRVSLPEKSHVSSTKEEDIPNVNESTSQDKGNGKMVKMPKSDNAYDRPIYEAPEQTARPNVFAWLGGRITQNKARPKN